MTLKRGKNFTFNEVLLYYFSAKMFYSYNNTFFFPPSRKSCLSESVTTIMMLTYCAWLVKLLSQKRDPLPCCQNKLDWDAGTLPRFELQLR